MAVKTCTALYCHYLRYLYLQHLYNSVYEHALIAGGGKKSEHKFKTSASVRVDTFCSNKQLKKN